MKIERLSDDAVRDRARKLVAEAIEVRARVEHSRQTLKDLIIRSQMQREARREQGV